MVHCGLLKIVLGLMLFAYTSVWSLETGYKYVKKHIENDELHKDLKCGYLFGGYTYIRLIKILLEEPYNAQFSIFTGIINYMNNIVRCQIVSLFGLNSVRIGAMWLLHLFTALVTSFHQDSKNPMKAYPKIFETLVFVINKLDTDLAGCRKGNLFDSYDSMLKSLQTFGFVTFRKTTLKKYFDKARGQLTKNGIISDGSLKKWLEESIKIQPLFLHNLGRHEYFKDDLQNVYNLGMKWNNTSTILYTAWYNARYLDWTNNNLYPIILYYNACYDFLKIIMFRLTLKHMTYLLNYTINSALYVQYAREWYYLVVQFGTMLKLSKDFHVLSLLNTLRNLINGTEILVSVVNFLVRIVVTLCQPFGCEASDQFAIDNREFTIPYKSLTEEEIKSLEITVSTVSIEYNSLMNAKTFLSHLKLTFSNVNFSAIRLLTEYIDELNPTNDDERSEECIEGLENLYFNMSDFE